MLKLKKIRLWLSNLSVQTKAAFVYMFASVLTKGVSVLTLPIFTRLLSTKDMGVVVGFNAWYSLLYPIITLSLTTSSLSVAMIDYKNEREKYQSVCLGISMFSSLLFFVFFLIFSKPISEFTSLSMPLILTQFLLFMFNPALDSWFLRQKFEYKYISVLAVSASITTLSVCVSIGAIYAFREAGFKSLGVVRIVSQNGVVALFALVFSVLIFLRGRCFFEKKIVKYALALSVPLIVHTLAKNVLDVSDRIMITRLCGESDAGIYGTVYNISLMATIIWGAVNAAIVPEMFSNLESKNYDNIRKMTFRVLLIMAGATILFSIVAPEMLRIFTTKEYYSAENLMPAIMIGVFFTAVYGVFGNVLIFYKKSTLVMIATIGAAVVNIVLNYIFIRMIGYQAAAYTTFVSFIILAVFEIMMQRHSDKENVVSPSFLLSISCIVVIACLLMISLYPYRWLRFFMFSCGMGLVVVYRNKIVEMLKKGK